VRLEQTVFAVRRQPEESVLDIVGTRPRLEQQLGQPALQDVVQPRHTDLKVICARVAVPADNVARTIEHHELRLGPAAVHAKQ
jgi:hypothetical protein